MQTTVLVDCSTSLILYIDCSIKPLHDAQIGSQVLKRNLHNVETFTADYGYDWAEFRHNLREEGVRLVIKYRIFSSLDAAHKARIHDTYHRRSVVESVFASLRRCFDDTIRARTWFGQFREIILKAAVKNIEAAIKL